MKRSLLLLLSLPLLLAVAAGCDKDEDSAPEITSLEPEYVRPGKCLFIHGKNFGLHRENVQVLFDGRENPIIAFSNDRIMVAAPEDGREGQTVAVNLKVGGAATNTLTLTYRPGVPEVTGIEGGRGVYDETVTVTGKNFGTVPAENEVYFDDVKAEVSEASETALKVKVPRIYKESVAVTVVRDGATSNAGNYDYDLDRCDSLLVVTADWKTEQLREGVVWKSAFLTAFGLPQSMNVVCVTPSSANKLGIANPASGTRKTSVQCEAAGALAGINAGYFSADKLPFVKIDGVVVQQGYDDVSATFGNAAIIIQDNRAEVRKVPGRNTEARTLEGDNILVGGPFLLKDKVVEALSTSSSHNTSKNPRTAVGVTEGGDVIFLTVDGRFPSKAAGMTTPQLAKAMWALGADDAMNLDGGGSTTLWISGKGVVNYPCDNGAFDHEGERSVGSILYVR